MSNSPWFSIMVSVFNRPKEISRCINSCLAQTFSDFELLIVDDGSTDDTIAVIKSFKDNRIHLISNPENSGMSFARALGHELATGKWIVRIDSDHALYPGALQQFYELSLKIAKDVGVIGAKYHWDNGSITPPFLPSVMPFDYIERIRWSEQNGDKDYIHCSRRCIFDEVNWPRRAGSTNALMELNIALNWKTHFLDLCLGEQYSDSENSYHRAQRGAKYATRLNNALGQAITYTEILEVHGNALKGYAPNKYGDYCLFGSFNWFLAKKRLNGLRYIVNYLRLRPLSIFGWVILFAGILGPWTLHLFYMMKPQALSIR